MAWKISDGRLDWLVVFATSGGAPVPMGALTFEGSGRVRQSLFRYARSWVDRPDCRPASAVGVPLSRKAIPSAPRELPLPFYDSMPDGWGKQILTLAFPNTVMGAGEFLAAAGDNHVGELHFGPAPDKPPQQWTPESPRAALPDGTESLDALLAAAEALDSGQPTAAHLQLLFRNSADLGGARPKASVTDDAGIWIAKFRARDDSFDNPRVEAVSLSVAGLCGADVPDHKVVDVAGRSVLLVKRFDRGPGGERLGYMSAGTLVGAEPTAYATSTGYADIAATARAAGIAPCEAELFRRMLINCGLNNTDDHLRNHAFLHHADGWRLSPLFDVVPNRGTRLILRPARGTDPTVDIGVATQSYEQFRLTREDAAAIVSDVRAGLAHLPEMLDQWGIVAADRELLAQVMPQVDLRKTMIPALNTTMTVDTAPRQSSETWTDNNKMGRPPRSALE